MPDAPDDDATRIYRPYGSPPPDPTEATRTPAPSAQTLEARAPGTAAGDPFAPDADPFASTAPATRSDRPAASDPFAPATTPDPFAPVADPFAPAESPAALDPFAPSSDPFAPLPGEPADDPFRSVAPDPFGAPADPFAPVAASVDPFAAFQGPAAGSFDAGPDSSVVDLGHARPSVALPRAFGTENTLAGSFAAVFSLVLQIRASDTLGDGAALQKQVEALLSASARSAHSAGATDADVEEATFCLIAFLDEAVLGSDWPGHAAWSAQPLQLTHYERYDAGERFFDRLKALLDTGAERTAVLEVYYLCLALGFKGRYGIHGRDVLRRLVGDLHDRLAARTPAGRLAVHGAPRSAPTSAQAGGVPTWALWAGAAVLVLLLYLGLSFSLSSAAGGTAADLRALSSAPNR